MLDLVVTELAVIAFPDGRVTLLETAPGISAAQVAAATEADLVIRDHVPEIVLWTIEQERCFGSSKLGYIEFPRG
jgi:acyl CoA:acetate/3-ketoacid CoA transferase beta subunit